MIRMKQIKSWKDAREWIKDHFTRKWTVWIHVVAGMFCGVLYHWYPGLAVLLFIAFGGFEFWQDAVEDNKGHLDFWDAMFGLFTGSGLLWILKLAGVVA